MHQKETSTEKYLQIVKQKGRCLSLRPSIVVVGVSQPHIHRLRHSSQGAAIHISEHTVFVGVRRIAYIENVFIVMENALVEISESLVE